LDDLGIETFLAHEDIEVSHEWQLHILDEIKTCDLFVAILSANYIRSSYCIQESGIAVFRGDMTIIPLSIDGTVPPGFIGHIQGRRIDPNAVDKNVLLAGIAKRAPEFVVDLLIDRVARSASYRGAEANFQAVLPHLKRATNSQIVRLLTVSAENGEVWDATLCKTKYLPPLFKSHGALLDKETHERLQGILEGWI
jgi:hypothetical protein